MKSNESYSSCLICKKCNICIHVIHCSCINSVTKAKICKNIYTCAHEFNKTPDDISNIIHTETNKNQKIINRTEIILGLSTTNLYSNKNREKIVNELDKIIELMNEGKEEVSI